jgi:cytochrome c oxidase cbb3-type subunit III
MFSRFLSIALPVLAAGCARERRDLHREPELPAARTAMTADRASGNAYAISEGRRLYEWMNCTGCHAEGGGDIGPPLMDGEWLYGGQPAAIYESIVQGRPNGMPPFGDRLTPTDVWQLVAYVRSLSGQQDPSARSGRGDDIRVKKSEQYGP